MRGMSTITPSIWCTPKIVPVTGHTYHLQGSFPICASFHAPNPVKGLVFEPIALACSIARTATLHDAPPEMVYRWMHSALIEIEWLITNDPKFQLSQYIKSLADTDRTSFAGHIGAGITDIMMNSLGYVWRDNAVSISGSRSAHADFIYGGGQVSGHGVVLAEAHGSFAGTISRMEIKRRANRKYERQVQPYLGYTSSHGKVIHGYSIAFGSKPTKPGAFLHVAEAEIPKQAGRTDLSAGLASPASSTGTPTSLALATQRSNFCLMGARTVVAWIDWARGRGERPDDKSPVHFLRLGYAGQTFLACLESLILLDRYESILDFTQQNPKLRLHLPTMIDFLQERRGFYPWFVMKTDVAERFLESLSSIIQGEREDTPEILELPTVEPFGLMAHREEEEQALLAPEYPYVLYRDGLALLGDRIEWAESFSWDPRGE